MAVDLAQARERCLRQYVRSARKSVKCLLSPAKTARCIVKTAFRNEKIAAVKNGPFNKMPSFIRGHFVFNDGLL